MLVRVPASVEPGSAAGPTVAFATFGIIVLISLYSRSAAQLWAPLIGILVGSVIAGAGFGMLDWTPLRDAAWFGLPNATWPGLDLEFDGRYFGLLIPFAIVTIIGAVLQVLSTEDVHGHLQGPGRSLTAPVPRTTTSSSMCSSTRSSAWTWSGSCAPTAEAPATISSRATAHFIALSAAPCYMGREDCSRQVFAQAKVRISGSAPPPNAPSVVFRKSSRPSRTRISYGLSASQSSPR